MTRLRVVEYELKESIEDGMMQATERLVGHPSSPLIFGATMGLIYFIDGPMQGLNWVADYRPSPDFDEAGMAPEFLESLASFLEETVSNIRDGKFNELLKPIAERIEHEGSA